MRQKDFARVITAIVNEQGERLMAERQHFSGSRYDAYGAATADVRRDMLVTLGNKYPDARPIIMRALGLSKWPDGTITALSPHNRASR